MDFNDNGITLGTWKTSKWEGNLPFTCFPFHLCLFFFPFVVTLFSTISTSSHLYTFCEYDNTLLVPLVSIADSYNSSIEWMASLFSKLIKIIRRQITHIVHCQSELVRLVYLGNIHQTTMGPIPKHSESVDFTNTIVF